MGKIICDVCGTSYSEGVSQCPICGCARATDNQYVSADTDCAPEQSQYKHVKGGRFSKANVKKRNRNNQKSERKTPVTQNTDNKEKSNKGLVITVLVLLLAILAVIAYIAVNFIFPIVFPKKEDQGLSVESQYVSEPPVTDAPNSSCTELLLEYEEITMREGETILLNVDVLPADSTDVLSFAVEDESIASVGSDGTITAISAGETKIAVTCGDITEYCSVTVEAMGLVLDHTEITLNNVGGQIVIYTGTLPVDDVLWYSDDENVAVITNGVVTAVGDGVTTVYGEYDDVIASCVVVCEMADNETTTEPTEGVIADNGPYRLDNPYGVSDTDASIYVGGSFTLYLVDKDENRVSGVTWSVESGSSCTVEDGLITGIAVGQSKVVATYGGESYTCIVRVS